MAEEDVVAETPGAKKGSGKRKKPAKKPKKGKDGNARARTARI